MTYGVENLVQWLSVVDDGDDYKQSYIYDYIQNRLYPGDPKLAQSFALRLLIHYVGDMHQPFHNEAEYSKDYLKGDSGANKVTLKNHYGASELHAVWDILMYTEHNSIARPIDAKNWASFTAHSNAIALNGTSAVSNPSDY